MTFTLMPPRALVLVVLFAVAGCGPDPSDLAESTVVNSAPQVADTGVVVRVIAIDNNFRPQAATANAGDTVEFTNKGKNDHNVLPQSGREWGVPTEGFRPKDVYSYLFSEPGVYAYYCSIHGTNDAGMVGTITVTK
jgi:plastocyanin